MRILHIINNLGMGGAERLIADLVPKFIDEGDTVRVLALSKEGDRYGEAIAESGAKVVYGRGASLWSPARAFDIARELREWRPDVVHVHLYPSLLWAALGKPRVSGTTWITTDHNTKRRAMDLAFLLPLERWIYRRFDIKVAISEAVRAELARRLGLDARDVDIVPNGVDLSRFGSIGRKPFPTAGKIFTILMVARMTEQKDHATVLRALAELSDEFRCVFVGQGPTMGGHAALARDLGLSSRVEFVGASDDVPGHMSGADLYVQSSRWEGFGMAAVEAMAAGLPVVASEVPGLAEVVGEAGLLVPAGDARALAEAIRRVAGDEDLARDLGSRGRARASMFSIESSAEGYRRIYGRGADVKR